LEIGGALDGAQLADAQHRARDGTLQTDRIRDERPHVRVGLQDQRNALDGGGVGTFAALNETLFEEFLRISELGNAPAGGAFAAKVIGHAFAICRLREHAREREFANAARAGKEQSVGHALGSKSTAESRDDAFVAEEFGKAHGQLPPAPESRMTCVVVILFTAARTSWAISLGERIAPLGES